MTTEHEIGRVVAHHSHDAAADIAGGARHEDARTLFIRHFESPDGPFQSARSPSFLI